MSEVPFYRDYKVLMTDDFSPLTDSTVLNRITTIGIVIGGVYVLMNGLSIALTVMVVIWILYSFWKKNKNEQSPELQQEATSIPMQSENETYITNALGDPIKPKTNRRWTNPVNESRSWNQSVKQYIHSRMHRTGPGCFDTTYIQRA